MAEQHFQNGTTLMISMTCTCMASLALQHTWSAFGANLEHNSLKKCSNSCGFFSLQTAQSQPSAHSCPGLLLHNLAVEASQT
jgi:hypothetical protein